MLKWFLGIVVIVGVGGAAAWWWLNRPLVIRHPDFGTDCDQLIAQGDLNRKVDCVRVWYGTNRKLETGDATLTSDTADVFEGTGENGEELRLGRADIWLPKLVDEGGARERGETPHVQGQAPSDANKLAEYVFLTRITTNGREHFTATLQDAIYYEGSNAVLLFVHGFNVKFDEALVRAAQLSNDLSRDRTYDVGVPVLYSWPSVGEVSIDDYRGDRDRSLASAPYLEEFLDLITEDLDVDRINIIAHSMGNRVLTKALEDYARDYLIRHDRDDLEFRILLVAADVEREVFAAANGVFDNLDANVTIYTSDTDRALLASDILNQAKRLGDTDTDKPYIRDAQNYQTIDATAVTTQLFGIGHNYYSDNPTILWDMMCTIAETGPQERALEIARYGGLPDGDQYYRVNASIAPDTEACTLHRSAFPAGGRAVDVADEAPPRRDRSLSPPPPPPAAAEPDIEPMAEPQSQPTVTRFYVSDYDSPDLTPYEAVLREVLESDETILSMTISAYNDTAGPDAESRIQTIRFANFVRDWFVNNGLDGRLITTVGYGEDQLAVLTEDGVAEQLNRRVVIEVVTN